MTISTLPPAPEPSDSPQDFNNKAFAFVAALDGFVTEANQLASDVNDDAVAAAQSASDATTNGAAQVALAEAEADRAKDEADRAELAADSAAGSANFKGEWSTLTGSLNIPASVSHNDQIWILEENVADVTLEEPGVSTKWTSLGGGGGADLQEFTTSGTWTKPTNATFVLVEAWGGGGGGASGARGAAGVAKTGGGGGGGGSYFYNLVKASDLPSTVSVTIGAGGAGGAAITNDNFGGEVGQNGGTTSFGAYVNSYGGFGGLAGFFGVSLSQSGGGTPILNFESTPSVFANLSFSGGSGGGFNSSVSGSGSPAALGGAGGGSGSAYTTSNEYGLAGSSAKIGEFYFDGRVYYPGVSGTNGSVFGQSGGGGAAGSFNAFSATSAAYGNSNFVLCTNPNTALASSGIIKSPNGTSNWEMQAGLNNAGANQVVFDGTKFVFINRFTREIYTTIDFSSYTKINTSITNLLPSVTVFKYLNNLYFINVGTLLYYSSDLITWTSVNPGLSQSIRDICWTGTNYVVVSFGGTFVRYSANLSSWSTPTSGGTVASYKCESNGAGSVVIFTTNTPFAQISTDNGVNFVNVSTTLATAGAAFVSTGFLNSIWFYASGNSLWTSSNGDTWTNRINASGDTLGGFAWDGTTYIVGSSTIDNTAVRSSTDLTTWTERAITEINGAGGKGGDGNISAGGGGGGASVNGNNSGAGGDGGDGYCRVYTW
jgi:hypothetical protein